MAPRFYQTKRYTLMVVCCITLVGSLIYAALALARFDKELKDSDDAGILIAAIVIVVLSQLFGLIGAWREQFCLTCTYTVLQVLVTISQVVQAITYPSVWINAILNLLVCIVAISFLVDLRTNRKSQTIHQTTNQPTNWGQIRDKF